MSVMSKRAEFYIQLLIDLAEYTSDQAARIYLKELKYLKSEKERAIKCYNIIEQRRQEIGLASFEEDYK